MHRILTVFLIVPALAAGCAADADTDTHAETAPQGLEASGGEDLPPFAERRLAHMTEELDLTEEQVALVREAMIRAHSEGHFARREGHEQMRQAMEDILTPEQLERLREHHGRHRGRHRGMRGAHFGPHAIERMAEELQLTDEQKQALERAFEEGRAAREALRDLAPEERRERRRAMREEHRQRIEQILTPEQLEQMRQMRGRRGGRLGRHGGRGMRMMHRFAEELELDDQQKEQLRVAFREAREARREGGVDPRSLDREQREALRRQRFEEMQGRIEAVLRPDQLERFRALRAEMETRLEGRWERRQRRQDVAPAPTAPAPSP